MVGTKLALLRLLFQVLLARLRWLDIGDIRQDVAWGGGAADLALGSIEAAVLFGELRSQSVLHWRLHRHTQPFSKKRRKSDYPLLILKFSSSKVAIVDDEARNVRGLWYPFLTALSNGGCGGSTVPVVSASRRTTISSLPALFRVLQCSIRKLMP